ncbi:MAG: tyrosine--tRNA ligase [Pseudomonadota bacterium]
MTNPLTFSAKSDFIGVLAERGFIHQGTNLEALDERAARDRLTGYIGFDATAKSLHVGSLIQIMMLYWFEQTGHRAIALMGGGTTKVGDPSFKDTARSLLTEGEIVDNIASIKGVFSRFLDFDAKDGAIMVDNAEWLDQLSYVAFLRDYGVHFTINRMLTFDSVKLRLDRESPLSFLEFNYMLMQAYDFHALYNRETCVLQMGGSDQWGNIVNGVELCRRKDGAEVFGLTTPLLTTASGKKMGKTEDGAVWLNGDMFSPYDYWQYWRNTEDADVATMLARFTVLPMDEVNRLGALQGAEINEAKKILATEATAMLHGREAAEKAAQTAQDVFVSGNAGDDLPSVTVTTDQLDAGYPVMEAFRAVGLIASNGEGRRHIKAGALKINDAPVKEERPLGTDDFLDGVIKLSVGKKKHGLVTVG